MRNNDVTILEEAAAEAFLLGSLYKEILLHAQGRGLSADHVSLRISAGIHASTGGRLLQSNGRVHGTRLPGKSTRMDEHIPEESLARAARDTDTHLRVRKYIAASGEADTHSEVRKIGRPKGRPKGTLSKKGREVLSERMKQRWIDAKKEGKTPNGRKLKTKKAKTRTGAWFLTLSKKEQETVKAKRRKSFAKTLAARKRAEKKLKVVVAPAA